MRIDLKDRLPPRTRGGGGYNPVTWFTDYAKNMGNTLRYNRLPKTEGILCL